MRFDTNITEKALEVQKEYAKKHKARYDAMLLEVYDKNPKLKQIDLELSKNGASAAIKALSGDISAVNSIKELSQKLSSQKQAILDDAGIKPFAPLCPVCNDSGFSSQTLCSCVKQIAKQMLTDRLKEQMPLENSSFDDFNLGYYSDSPDDDGNIPKKRMKSIFQFCKTYADTFTKNSESLLFLGGAGLGKTHLSLAICNEVLNGGFGVIYCTAGNLMSRLEKEYFSHEGTQYLDAVLESDLVIIDDLGTEFSTQFSQSNLYNIINTRILSNKPTIISTNLSFAELEERYTARIASRLAGVYTVKKFLGRDIRIIKATSK